MKPPAAIESEEASRPTRDDDTGRRAACCATEGDAKFVGSCEIDEIAPPHSGQKRADSEISAEQDGQGIKLGRF